MPGQMQTGTGIGDPVGPDTEGRGSIREHLNPQTEAGEALLVAGVAFTVLLLTVGRGQSGMGAKLLAVGQFIGLVLVAEVVGNWAARTWVGNHPDAPGSAGIMLNI